MQVLQATKALLFVLVVLSACCEASKKHKHRKQCSTYSSSCGNIYNISYPFQLRDDPADCGEKGYDLVCENNRSTVLYLAGGSAKYYVREINYHNYTIRVVEAGIIENDDDNSNNNCCFSRPRSSFSVADISFFSDYDRILTSSRLTYIALTSKLDPVVFLSCENSVNSPLVVADTCSACHSPKGRRECLTSSTNDTSSSACQSLAGGSSNSFSGDKKRNYSYVMTGGLSVFDVPDLCRVDAMTMTSSALMRGGEGVKNNNLSFSDIHDDLVFGFELSWIIRSCKEKCDTWFFPRGCYRLEQSEVECTYALPLCPHGGSSFLCRISGVVEILFGVLEFTAGAALALHVAVKIVIGIPFILILMVYKWRRRHLSVFDSIERFLLNHNHNLMPIRYSYSEIKKMTRGFKDKLGEGGYGFVYKGKVRSGSLVAVKVLGESKKTNDGQEFINEVATIGRIHHFNVVRLVGYCAEGSKRALVYDFMPNGSLEKYVFSKETSKPGGIILGCEEMYNISLGVARGMEYLHRGCDMQILHFDIKPHNILLDEKFIPKISDFGLAKLYSTDKSIVSLTAARGTLGYMAPELFYKNIGGVSYKADVYSFGMLLLEMAGRRKNVSASADHTSEIYFPSWAHNQLCQGNDIEIENDATDEEKEVVKKMAMVALWCIQMKPNDRPSMRRIVEMLEGGVELLEMPPKPMLDPGEVGKPEGVADDDDDKDLIINIK